MQERDQLAATAEAVNKMKFSRMELSTVGVMCCCGGYGGVGCKRECLRTQQDCGPLHSCTLLSPSDSSPTSC